MISLIRNHRRLATGIESHSCLEPLDMARIIDLFIMEGESCEPHLPKLRVEEGADNGDNDDNHGIILSTGDDGYGVNNMDLGAIVDGVLADLPEPTQHHILPELEEYDRENPAPCSAI